MRYLGSKESLVPKIKEMLNKHGLLKRNLIFFDAFCGMGAVADSLKGLYFNIIVNDSLKCATVFTQGRLFSSDCSFERLGFSPFDYLNENKEIREGFIFKNYSLGGSKRMYFTAENAGRIDYFRFQIEEWKAEGFINEKEYIYLLACLMDSVSNVSNTAGVYGAFLKHWDKRALNAIQFSRLASDWGTVPNLVAYNDKIENIIGTIDCDILYLDPPYTQNQYGTQYHLLETLILNDNPSISKITGSRPTGPMRSDWSKMYHSHILFEKVIAETKAKHIILSYNNDGFMSKEFIESTLKRYGKEETYSFVSIDYKKYNNFKCQDANGHCEFLFYIEKKNYNEVVVESPLNYTGSKTKMVDVIKQHLPKQTCTQFIDAFGGGFNVGINIDAKRMIYNDINPYVMGLISSFREDTYNYLLYINRLIAKFNLSPENKEGYLQLRKVYNDFPIEKRDPRMLYTLVLYGFQQQIRFNTSHEFNNPSGSRWFNEKLLSKFISFARCASQKEIVFRNLSFEKLMPDIDPETIVYADPPYRATLGVYNDGKRGFEGWSFEHENKLCNFLDAVNAKGALFMLSYVMRVDGFNNANIAMWSERNNYNVIEVVHPQGRYNNRMEVLITNY